MEPIRRLAQALRGGHYIQGRNQLRKGDRYCVMGVACDLFDTHRWARYQPPHGEEIWGYQWKPGSEALNRGDPPDDVVEWLGLDDEDVRRLTNLNDGGISFERIADHIEERYISTAQEE